MGQIPNSPLIEAIFELRWGDTTQGLSYTRDEIDLLPGVFSGIIKNHGYVHTERPILEIDRPSLPFEPRYRFRKEPNTWPCFQLGLGILTANQVGNLSLESGDTDDYDWDTFKPAIEIALNTMQESLSPDGLKSLRNPIAILRYQDGFILGAEESNESFIGNKIQADIQIKDLFTQSPDISDHSKDVRLKVAYDTTKPEGSISIAVTSASITGKRGILIDTAVQSNLGETQANVDHLMTWCEEAHELQRHSFQTLIDTSEL